MWMVIGLVLGVAIGVAVTRWCLSGKRTAQEVAWKRTSEIVASERDRLGKRLADVSANLDAANAEAAGYLATLTQVREAVNR